MDSDSIGFLNLKPTVKHQLAITLTIEILDTVTHVVKTLLLKESNDGRQISIVRRTLVSNATNLGDDRLIDLATVGTLCQ